MCNTSTKNTVRYDGGINVFESTSCIHASILLINNLYLPYFNILNYPYLGVLNAADYYGLDELKQACSGFIQCCVTVDTVCALLATAERYIQYKCTKYLVHKVYVN